MRLAPEGLPFVAGGVAVLAGFGLAGALLGGGWWAVPAGWAPIAAWIPWFFRNPEREGPRGDDLILAPADGRVVRIGECEEPEFIGGRARQVSVFMNVFDVHVNRHPVTGTAALCAYRPGKFVNAALDKASDGNERMTLGVTSARGPVLVRQIAGLIARRIVTDARPGDAVCQGERLGMIRFGSRVDTVFSTDAAVTVGVGDRTVAGVTVIGRWP